jgi:hypothetical protein
MVKVYHFDGNDVSLQWDGVPDEMGKMSRKSGNFFMKKGGVVNKKEGMGTGNYHSPVR